MLLNLLKSKPSFMKIEGIFLRLIQTINNEFEATKVG